MSLVAHSIGAARIWSPLIILATHSDEIIEPAAGRLSFSNETAGRL